MTLQRNADYGVAHAGFASGRGLRPRTHPTGAPYGRGRFAPDWALRAHRSLGGDERLGNERISPEELI